MERLNITTEILDVGEARRRLPLIKPEVERIMEISSELRSIQESMLRGERASDQETEGRLQQLREEWKRCLRRINELGGYLKDPEAGLLDFYTWMDGDLAFLCWRHGEDDLRWWHGLEAGFAGRRPLPPEGQPG